MSGLQSYFQNFNWRLTKMLSDGQTSFHKPEWLCNSAEIFWLTAGEMREQNPCIVLKLLNFHNEIFNIVTTREHNIHKPKQTKRCLLQVG